MAKRIILLVIFLTAAGLAMWLAQNQTQKGWAGTPLVKKEFTEELIGERQLRAERETEVELLLVGDIMLSRNVASMIQKHDDPLLPFANISALLKQSDFNFGNLESPFSESLHIPPSGSLIFNAPKTFHVGLVENNFKVLSIANNHALDQGLTGLKTTRELLAASGIAAIGAGNDQAQAWEPAIVELRGLKIGFLAASYASVNDGGKSRNDYVARTDDVENLKLGIENLKSRSDFIVVSMHAGNEYTHRPNATQQDFARAAIDAGADVVVGHHPHWVQPIEKYCPQPHLSSPYQGEEPTQNTPPLQGGIRGGKSINCGLIFYSLGNFIFDQEWSQKTKQGLAVRLTLEGAKLKSAELVPVLIENYCCARLADEQESKQILESIRATSTLIKL
ncbi:MAG: CapA family protein [Candidatus Doudnabacteria bacterium]|nr:CapA family protein [Candidatus Doudnabacteria bacterium]